MRVTPLGARWRSCSGNPPRSGSAAGKPRRRPQATRAHPLLSRIALGHPLLCACVFLFCFVL